jgi:tetratricopeptide (TPR) repeat protein
VPDFAAWAAAAVLDTSLADAEARIESLVTAQLLTVVGTDVSGQTRYSFHGLIRLLAREFCEAEEPARTRRSATARALGAWLALAESCARRLPEQVAANITGSAPRWRTEAAESLAADPLAWFEAEQAALMSCVSQACRTGFDEFAWELAAQTAGFCAYRGRYDDWRHGHELALEACEQAGNRKGEAVMIRDLACLNFTGVRTVRGVLTTRTETAFRCFQDLDEPYGEVDALCFTVFANRFNDDREYVAGLVQRGMAIAEKIGYVLGQARLWCLLAVMAGQEGRDEAAARHAERSLDLAERSGSLHDRVLALWELAAACPGGRTTALLLQTIEICREREEQLLEAYLRLALSRLRLRAGAAEIGTELETALEVFDRHAVSFGRATGLRVLGEMSLAQGDHARARGHLREALPICRELRNAHEEALVLRSLGTACRESGDVDEARSAWQTAHRLFRRLGNTTEADRVAVLLILATEPRPTCRHD